MEIKYQQKTLTYLDKEITYSKVKQFVLEQLPQLKQKTWTFTYFDAQCDQVIIGDDQDFASTIDYYQSIQKNLVLIVKQMWWKHKKVHSRSKLVKELLARKTFQNIDYKFKPYNPSDSDSDDDFIHIDFKPGQIYIDDSQEHVEEATLEKTQANTELLQNFRKREDFSQIQRKKAEEIEVTVGIKNENKIEKTLE